MPNKKIKEILRVNHSGEYSAVYIYQEQNKINKNPIFLEMLNQEKKHLKIFEKLIIQKKISPSLFLPLWRLCSKSAGKISVLLGENYAHALTVIVEEVIEQHYQKQLQTIETTDELFNILLQHKLDEEQHKNHGKNLGGECIKFFNFYRFIIQKFLKGSIYLSTKI